MAVRLCTRWTVANGLRRCGRVRLRNGAVLPMCQSSTQYKATVKTADEMAAVAGKSTVGLKLTAVRELGGAVPAAGAGAIAVLSPSTLLLSHTYRMLDPQQNGGLASGRRAAAHLCR
jgi:hypothetical protein